MTSPSQEDPKPDGALFDDYFESLGKKAERLNINDKNEKSPGANNDAPTEQAKADEEEQRVVDEIESLCMNCHENVPCPQSRCVMSAKQTTGNYTFTPYSNPLLPGNHPHVLLLPSLQLQELRDTICRRDTAKGI
jgi:hypothetical protein